MTRPMVGKLVVGIGVIHMAASAVFYRDDVAAIIGRGVLNAVEPAGAAALDGGFWYLSAGLGMLMYGGLVWWYERNVGPAPAIVGGRSSRSPYGASSSCRRPASGHSSSQRSSRSAPRAGRHVSRSRPDAGRRWFASVMSGDRGTLAASLVRRRQAVGY